MRQELHLVEGAESRIGLVKMRSDRILICLSLLCRHTDVKGKRKEGGAVVIRLSRLIGELKKRKKEDLSADCFASIFVPLSSCA